MRNDLIALLNLKELVGGAGLEPLLLGLLIEVIFAVVVSHRG
jgi:hypothetical protein